jgi:hypothetical protein
MGFSGGGGGGLNGVTIENTPTAGQTIEALSTTTAEWITGGGGPPSGVAGGDLGGTYPNPLVLESNGVAFGSAAFDAASTFAQVANNLSDLASASTARTNLGLGTAATVNTPVSIANGGTGQITAAAAFNALNPNAAPVNVKVATPAGTVSTALVMLGCGSTCTYTPASSGLVLVSVTAYGYCTTASTGIEVGGRYGTGTAPANGVAVSGTRFGASAESYVRPSAASNTNSEAIAFTDIITLTPGTAYWFDLAFATTNAADLCTIYNVSMSFVELAA